MPTGMDMADGMDMPDTGVGAAVSEGQVTASSAVRRRRGAATMAWYFWFERSMGRARIAWL